MTATDELRKLLDERGIEWSSEIKGLPFFGSFYGVTFVGDWSFCEYATGELSATCKPVLTPEQAIAALLGGQPAKLTAEQVRDFLNRHSIFDDTTWMHGTQELVFDEDELQAMADELNATLGSGTFHDANTRFNAWTCSECKCTQLLMFDDYGEPTLSVDGVASVPNYCPNCGAKVVGE